MGRKMEHINKKMKKTYYEEGIHLEENFIRIKKGHDSDGYEEFVTKNGVYIFLTPSHNIHIYTNDNSREEDDNFCVNEGKFNYNL